MQKYAENKEDIYLMKRVLDSLLKWSVEEIEPREGVVNNVIVKFQNNTTQKITHNASIRILFLCILICFQSIGR